MQSGLLLKLSTAILGPRTMDHLIISRVYLRTEFTMAQSASIRSRNSLSNRLISIFFLSGLLLFSPIVSLAWHFELESIEGEVFYDIYEQRDSDLPEREVVEPIVFGYTEVFESDGDNAAHAYADVSIDEDLFSIDLSASCFATDDFISAEAASIADVSVRLVSDPGDVLNAFVWITYEYTEVDDGVGQGVSEADVSIAGAYHLNIDHQDDDVSYSEIVGPFHDGDVVRFYGPESEGTWWGGVGSWTDDGLCSATLSLRAILLPYGSGSSVEDPELPDNIARLHASPNPFNPSTTISFILEEKSSLSLGIFDLRGRLVFSLIYNDTYEPGTHTFEWSGQTNSGLGLGSGVYFALLESTSFREIVKLTLIK